MLWLLLLAVSRPSSAELLRKATSEGKRFLVTKQQVENNLKKNHPKSSITSSSNSPNLFGNNSTSSTEKDKRDLLDIESRVVGGNIVTDVNKHPFFAEWHGQFCGGSVCVMNKQWTSLFIGISRRSTHYTVVILLLLVALICVYYANHLQKPPPTVTSLAYSRWPSVDSSPLW